MNHEPLKVGLKRGSFPLTPFYRVGLKRGSFPLTPFYRVGLKFMNH
jgi:hypothetical protein